MPSTPASQQPATPRGAWWAALACAAAGFVVFQFLGNANHGYIATDSLFWWWAYQWLNPASELEHGWLILGLSGWLLWRNVTNAECGMRSADLGTAGSDRDSGGAARGSSSPQFELRNPRFSFAPLAALLGGLGLHAMGFLAQQARLSIVALLLFTWGVLRFGGGRRWGSAAAFPLAFLVFAMPVDVLDSVGFWLRLWVVGAGKSLAHLMGIPVIQSGTQLLAPDGAYNYDVAAACSGVRSLMALAALSLLIGYLGFRSCWKRALLFLLCFPLVHVGNVARIVAIIVAAHLGGPAWGDRAHAVMGYGVFVIVLGGVLGAAALLKRLGAPLPFENRAPQPGAGPGAGTSAGFRVATGTALVVIAVALGEMALLSRAASMPHGGAGIVLAPDGAGPVELPLMFGREWVGLPAPVTAVERAILPPDTGYSRVEYTRPRDGRRVFLSIVLSGRDRSSIHRPELCLLGQGWTLSGRSTHRFTYPDNPDAAFSAAVLQTNRPGVGQPAGRPPAPQLVVYWFVGEDRVVASHWERLAWDAWNRLSRRRPDRWAYVLMQTDASDGEAEALARMQSLLNATLPLFQKPLR